jgi:hypothetical protein
MKNAINRKQPSRTPKSSSNPAEPIDIGKAKERARRKSAAPHPSPAPPSSTDDSPDDPTPQPSFPPNKQRVLELIALGSSVTAAMEAVGGSRSCFYKWAKKDASFEHYGNRARGIHIADIDDALHELDTDARALVHHIVVDENVSPGIRLRAALAALTRKGPGWLPRELPPHEYGTQPSLNRAQVDGLGVATEPTNRVPSVQAEGLGNLPSEARPSQPPASPSTPANPNTVECVELLQATAEPIQLQAHQQLPTLADAPTTPTAMAKNVESVEFSNPGLSQPELQNQQPGEARPPQPPASPSTPASPNTPVSVSTEESVQLPPTPQHAPPRSALRDHAFFSHYTVHRHESPRDFQRLFRELVASHQPQTQAEELTVLRIAQAFWRIRRIDTMEMAVADSTIEQVQQDQPTVQPAAALATAFLTAKPTLQATFFDRMRRYRRAHEDTVDRLENRLTRQQQQRQSAALREAKLTVLRHKARRATNRVLVRETRLEARINQNFRSALMPLPTAAPLRPPAPKQSEEILQKKRRTRQNRSPKLQSGENLQNQSTMGRK